MRTTAEKQKYSCKGDVTKDGLLSPANYVRTGCWEEKKEAYLAVGRGWEVISNSRDPNRICREMWSKNPSETCHSKLPCRVRFTLRCHLRQIGV